MTVINHPIGTHHTMSRKWLDENSLVYLKKDVPESVQNEYDDLYPLAPVASVSEIISRSDIEKWSKFHKNNGKYLYYQTQYGKYDYSTTLKIFDK